MAYCTLEEAWGQDYKSFLSPASLSPDWLEDCRKPMKKQDTKAPPGFSSEKEKRYHYSDLPDHTQDSRVEHFSSPKKLKPINEDEDYDLMVRHDEFNLPMHFESPEALDPGLDDYYKLINSDIDQDTINSYRYPYQDTNYAEEVQFHTGYSKKCHSALPNKTKYHLKKCKHCRNRMKEWLRELGDIVEDIPKEIHQEVIKPTKDHIKQLVPREFRGYVDLLFFIAIGVFLIFVLDTFVRLGKSFSRK